MEMETEAKPQEQSQEQSQEMPLAEPQNAENAIEVESSIPTPSFTPQPETVENSPSSQTADEASSASNSEVAPSEPTTVPSSPSSQSQSHSHKPHDKVAPPPPQIKRRPRRTGQPLHLLLQDCSRQHIMGSLCKKTPEDITAIITDKKALAADLQVYSNEFVLTTARDKVIVEVDEQGKELLKEVSPETEVVKQRFEDESSVFKSYEDAMHDIRVDLYLDSLKPRKQESGETPESLARTAELNAVLQVWDQHHKRIDVEPRRAGRATQSPYPGRGVRPTGPPGSRSYSPLPSSRGPPPAHYGAPYPPSRAHHRDNVDRPPYRDDYYADRRDDYRRPDYERHDPRDHPMARPAGPGAVGRPDARDPRDFRDRPPPARGDHPYAAGARFDDRRRDRPDHSQAPAPRDRHLGGAGLSAHPSLPPKPHNAFDSAQHSQVNAYSGAQDYSYPYGAYPQDPAAAAYYGAQGWDMTGAAANAAAAATGLLMQPFNSVQHGRHKAVPLPTDFMSGPSEAPRLSMPEPHQVLGTIHGVIIRDAHGNIGLSQYQFTQAK
ncbi:hypothetical protein CPC16_007006 [Podila verticillata]|nr:hypothetical protein CPC16_007006 [Podila verticillata]